jgi:hypothetical protein
VHTVELLRLGGPLGLTISGTEMRGMPITISALRPGTLKFNVVIVQLLNVDIVQVDWRSHQERSM